jgi:hypothetical protein
VVDKKKAAWYYNKAAREGGAETKPAVRRRSGEPTIEFIDYGGMDLEK